MVFVSGLLGIACAGSELVAGAYGTAMHIDRSAAVLGLGMVGALLSSVVVALGVAGRREPRRWVGAAAAVMAVVTGVVGGTFVALPMLGALAGGAMLVGGSGRTASSGASKMT